MTYYGFGIQVVESDSQPSHVWWIASTKHEAWLLFFRDSAHRLPLADAIRAYEAIGYRAVELEVRVKA